MLDSWPVLISKERHSKPLSMLHPRTWALTGLVSSQDTHGSSFFFKRGRGEGEREEGEEKDRERRREKGKEGGGLSEGSQPAGSLQAPRLPSLTSDPDSSDEAAFQR